MTQFLSLSGYCTAAVSVRFWLGKTPKTNMDIACKDDLALEEGEAQPFPHCGEDRIFPFCLRNFSLVQIQLLGTCPELSAVL